MHSAEVQEQHFQRTFGFLMRSFETVLRDLGEDDVAQRLPWRSLWAGEGGEAATAEDYSSERVSQAYSIAFQLMAQAEENAVAQRRRAAENSGTLAADPGSWDQHFERLKAAGKSDSNIAETLSQVHVEPVLTAHPTEAKRQTILEHYRALYRVVVDLENSMWSASERAALEAQARSCIEKLWRTGDIFIDKPTVSAERRAIMYYLTEVFPATLPWVDFRLKSAWARAGFSEKLLQHNLPKLTFGNWVGGDRDGHPFVEADTTAETLAMFRSKALEQARGALTELGIALSLSERLQTVPETLTDFVAARTARLGHSGETAIARNISEPWRQAVNLMLASMPDDTGRPAEQCYGAVSELVDDLQLLRSSLCDVGAERMCETIVDPVLRRITTMGFHLAAIDIRQNSSFHDRALGQLLSATGEKDGDSFPDWEGPRRAALIKRELDTFRPFTTGGSGHGEEADKVVGALRVFADHSRTYGTDGLGSLIVSMTRTSEDLFTVFLFAREAGLLRTGPEGNWCPVPVAPLLETIEDLENGPEILDRFLDEPIVRRSLEKQAERNGDDMPIQQVMIGYSDSGKDGGFLASIWTLYRAQIAIAELCRKKGVRACFFHGRGGSIGRGSGPTHRFLRALPPGTVQGGMRMTEQGESISQKYANRITAAHQFELLLAGVLGSTLEQRNDPPDLIAAMEVLAQRGRRAYEDLINADGFLTFFDRATPIDAIEQNRIGSRPSRRSGKRSMDDLRAIPWVFAWNQSRFGLPGWFGMGTAFASLRDSDGAIFESLVRAKSEEHRWSPIHYLVSNAATAWATSSAPIMERYANLIEDIELRDRILGTIDQEFERTEEILTIFYGAAPRIARPEIQRAIDLRNQALEPLHNQQIRLLKKWRALRDDGKNTNAEALLPTVLLSVNAIASGLGGTG
ncbi:phosphoenolpyruvate carboxylase [Algicella marina]|uniref:Phosphoenolpyruvate carboxylase n=1 Tax=Algicella marina TaxID=2683284 RepID=A0A6P1SZA1_9RHOB|nr:phosphoenolpyruvate carboxylase [Algicella marina]QHQ36014.1 phosphoenolpyruvate carboxylase [Algicella marina]